MGNWKVKNQTEDEGLALNAAPKNIQGGLPNSMDKYTKNKLQ